MRKFLKVACLAVTAAMVLSAGMVMADGTEELGTPGIEIADGDLVVAAGTGLRESGGGQPQDITLNVPAGSVEQVLLYYVGVSFAVAEDDCTGFAEDTTVEVDGMEVDALRIGGPSQIRASSGELCWASYRADITELGLIGNGANTVSVGGLTEFEISTEGSGLMVIVDNGSGGAVDIRDGFDFAFINRTSPFDTTVEQVFSFAASPDPRTASLTLFNTSVQRLTNAVAVTVDGGMTMKTFGLLNSNDGDFWDTTMIDVEIPAGANSVAVQVLSEAPPASIELESSLVWVTAALTIEGNPFCGDGNLDEGEECDDGNNEDGDGCSSTCMDEFCGDGFVQPPEECDDGNNEDGDGCDADCMVEEFGEGCTPGYWKGKLFAWEATPYAPSQPIKMVFSGAETYVGDATLLDGLNFGGGPDLDGAARILLRAAIASLLNASHPNVDFSISTAAVISDTEAALASADRTTMLNLATMLDDANNVRDDDEDYCPLPGNERKYRSLYEVNSLRGTDLGRFTR